MGLFSKTKTYIESSTIPLYEEVNDTVKQTVLNSVLQDKPIAEDLRTNLITGLGVKSLNYFKYGRDEFFFGLPEGNLELPYASASAVKTVLDSLNLDGLSTPTVVAYNIYGKADASYFAHEHLTNNRDWDSSTNIVSAPNFNSLGNTVTFYSAEWITGSQIKINYLYTDDDNLESEIITLGYSVDINEFYYHVAYYFNTDLTTKYFWYYSPSENLYSSLDVTETNVPASLYYPIVPIRRDNQDLADSALDNTELWQTSKKLLKRIDIDFQDLSEAIHENPDIDQVDHCFLTLGVNIQTENQNSLDYLFQYFTKLMNEGNYSSTDYTTWVAETNEYKNSNPPPLNVIKIEETENSSGQVGNYNTELGYLYIEDNIVTGSIGKKGYCESQTIINNLAVYNEYAYETSSIVFRKQITLTTYTEITVHGLKHVNYIYNDKHIDTTLEDSLDAVNDKNNFTIPLRYDAVRGMSAIKRTDLMKDAIRLNLHSVEKVKLKWYQTGIFKAIIIIVAAIITIALGGADGGTILAAVVGAVGATTYLAILLVTIIYNALVSLAISKLIEIIGLEEAAILYLIYTIYSLSTGNLEVLSSEFLISAVNGINTSVSLYLKAEYLEFQSESDKILKQQAEEQEELDKLMEAFPKSYLDPLAYADNMALISPEESPEQFYNNRIHVGNIGALALNEAYYYVKGQMQLPGVVNRKGLDFY
tara:strand:- start:54723 stop:56834 length:2112 start_codon:yes stop_codon:yes gene_type:complete